MAAVEQSELTYRSELSHRESESGAATAAGFGTASWTALGTGAQLVLTEPAGLAPARKIAETQVAAIDRAASRFRADSELSRLNAADGRWLAISPLFAQALRVAIDAAAWTDGLVDPTIGATLIALGYDRTFVRVDPDGSASPPTTGSAPGWQQIELDEAGCRVRVPTGVQVDLGATAKALAADLIAAQISAELGGGVLVNLGGDISIAGALPAGGWPVTVTDLSDPDRTPGRPGQLIALHSGGLATSSTRARRWRRGGSLLHHLIDPRSGLPTNGPWRTISVTAASCALANTASTAAMVLGSAAPGWLTARGFAARLVLTDGAAVHIGSWPIEGERP